MNSAQAYELSLSSGPRDLVLTVNEVEVSRLRLARQNAHLTSEQLAEKTELTAAYLSQLETSADKRRAASLAAKKIITAALSEGMTQPENVGDLFEARPS